MCIQKKGTGYDPVVAVQNAIEKTQWSTGTFFAHAKKKCGNGFNSEVEAAKFVAHKADHGYVPLKAVSTFADWVNLTDIKRVLRKTNEHRSQAPAFA